MLYSSVTYTVVTPTSVAYFQRRFSLTCQCFSTCIFSSIDFNSPLLRNDEAISEATTIYYSVVKEDLVEFQEKRISLKLKECNLMTITKKKK